MFSPSETCEITIFGLLKFTILLSLNRPNLYIGLAECHDSQVIEQHLLTYYCIISTDLFNNGVCPYNADYFFIGPFCGSSNWASFVVHVESYITQLRAHHKFRPN